MSNLANNTTTLQSILESVNSLPSATTVSAPTITVSANGLITATSGTKSSTKQLTTQAAKTVTPSTSSQTAVASGVYTTGAITVAGDTNLKAENIKSGISIFGVTGTHEGGSGVTCITGTATMDSSGIVTVDVFDTDDSHAKIYGRAWTKAHMILTKGGTQSYTASTNSTTATSWYGICVGQVSYTDSESNTVYVKTCSHSSTAVTVTYSTSSVTFEYLIDPYLVSYSTGQSFDYTLLFIE